jgi:cobalt-precorrin 5A hydrolase
MKIAVIAITRNGARVGARLRESIPGAELHVLRKYSGDGEGLIPFDELKGLVAALWKEASGLVFIMATGIVVRMIALHLQGKAKDPAVVVMDEAGKFAISLLSGHLGGANELAGRCAFAVGAREVITTATDAAGLPSFDMLAKEFGWEIEDLSRVKRLNALLLDGEEIAVVDPTGSVRTWFHGRGKLHFCDTFVAALRTRTGGIVAVTNSIIPPQVQGENLLVLRPKNLVLGIGCNSGTTAGEIAEVAAANLKRLLLSEKSVACVATVTAKRNEAGLLAFAEGLGVPLVFHEPAELAAVPAPSPPSPHALEAVGAPGVAEPAALLSSGGTLILKKVKSGNVTLAIAEKT